MQDDSIQNTFNTIKKLPLQVDYSKIERFVLSQPLTVFIHTNYSWLNFKNIIIMTTSASFIGILVMLNQGDPVQTAQSLKEQEKEIVKKEIVQPPQEEHAPESLKTAVVLPIEVKHNPEKKTKPLTVSIPATAVENTIVEVPTVEAEPVTAANLTVPPVAEEPASGGNPVVADCNPEHKFPCNCKCNDGNNVTCTFKEKLLDDEIIGDSEKFSFKIDNKSFVVNGKIQPENTYKKYSRVYKELTGQKLTEGSYMSVTVDKDNCNIIINYNDDEKTGGD